MEGKKGKTYFSLNNLKPVISNFDKEIGRLLSGLEKMGIAENTLILFTSDNGPAPTFDHERTIRLRGCKNSLYEGGIKMPFIAYWPSVIKGGQVDKQSILSAVDLYPTLCKIVGITLPENRNFDGQDLSRAFLSSKIVSSRRKIFWEYGRKNPKYSIPKDVFDRSPDLAVRQGKWKCLPSFDGRTVELYNLQNDPKEEHNLAEKKTKMAAKYKKEMLDWFSNVDENEVMP